MVSTIISDAAGQLSLLEATAEQPFSGTTLIASRPIVDLSTQQITAYEFMSCDLYGFVQSNMPLTLQNIDDALESASVLNLDEIILSVPMEIFNGIDLSEKLAWKLRLLLSQGTHVNILLSEMRGPAASLGTGNAVQSWRKIGCSVGIDGFGYAAVPALWPLVHHVDLVRIDPRLVSMLRANVIPTLAAQKLVRLVASMNIPRIIVDGCIDMNDAHFFQETGATHGQGPVFGEFHLTNPR